MLSVDLVQQVARFALTGDSSLYILLPTSNRADELQQVEERMTDATLRQMIHKLKAVVAQAAEVTLPRISLEVEPNMLVVMKKLGLPLL